jgi:hypothetical protein
MASKVPEPRRSSASLLRLFADAGCIEVHDVKQRRSPPRGAVSERSDRAGGKPSARAAPKANQDDRTATETQRMSKSVSAQVSHVIENDAFTLIRDYSGERTDESLIVRPRAPVLRRGHRRAEFGASFAGAGDVVAKSPTRAPAVGPQSPPLSQQRRPRWAVPSAAFSQAPPIEAAHAPAVRRAT